MSALLTVPPRYVVNVRMQGALVGSVLGLATLAWSARAVADESPPASSTPSQAVEAASIDTIYLRSGGSHRGRITELVPGDHVTIMADGSFKQLAWSDVDRIVAADQGASGHPIWGTPEELNESNNSPSPSPPFAAGARLRVKIETRQPVDVYRQPAGTATWDLVCRAPCTADVPARDAYRVQGNGIATSRSFRLDAAAPGETVTVAVAPSSQAGVVLGYILVAAGGVAGTMGLATLVTPDEPISTRSTNLVLIGVGAGLVVSGALIVEMSRSTNVAVQRSGPASRKDAFLRVAPPSHAPESARAAPMPAFATLFESAF